MLGASTLCLAVPRVAATARLRLSHEAWSFRFAQSANLKRNVAAP